MPTTYPASLDTDNSLFVAVNGLQTAVTVDPGVGGTSINVTLNSTTGFPSTGYIAIDSEVILYTGKTSSAFTGCTRGADGTSAAAHAVNAPVYGCNAADHHNALKDAIKALQAKVGVNSNGAIGTTLDGFQLAPTTVNYGKLVIPLAGNLRHQTQYRARARNNANQSPADNVATKVSFQTEDFDPNNNFDNVTNYRYTVPVTGIYLVTFVVNVGPGAQTALISGYIAKNGTEVPATRSIVHIAANSQRAGVSGSHILSLTAADYLEIFVIADGSVGGCTVVGDTTGDASCSFHYLSE